MKPLYQRRHYEHLAAYMREFWLQYPGERGMLRTLINGLCQQLGKDNPQFDADHFKEVVYGRAE